MIGLFLGVEDDTIILLLEPLHGVFLGETVLESDHAALASSLGDVVACKDNYCWLLQTRIHEH